MTQTNSPLPNREEMYQALVNKDRHYEGVFIAAITTTGIFCRSSCTAKKPKQENVEYYKNCTEALNFGFRPCKVCCPLLPLDATPKWIAELLGEISAKNYPRLKDQDLRDKGIEPAKLRRWFKKHHGMTFQGYLRSLRLGQAVGQITLQASVTKTAFDSGYDSLSGFSEAIRHLTGCSPKDSHKKTQVVIYRVLTPLGPMLAGMTATGLCLLEFTDRRMLETQLKRITQQLNAYFVPGQPSQFELLTRQLDEYFTGSRHEFTIPLDLAGTDFQQRVWQGLLTIPFGATRSYQQQAELIQNVKAVRAVAKANGDNRISIIVPCHRVIGKNGALTGYGGGLWRKKRLLELEKSA